MIIRNITVDDLPTIISLAQQMHAESTYAGYTFDYDKALNIARHILVSTKHCAFVAESSDEEVFALLVAYVDEFFFSKDLQAQDYLVYAAPSRRGSSAVVRLIEMYEAWAKDVGAKRICLGVSAGINDDRVRKLYSRLGYNVGATLHVKETV